MDEKTKKYCWQLYFLLATAVSFYIHKDAPTLLFFLGVSLVTLAFFIGIYFCIRDISQSRVSLKVTRILCIAVLVALLFASWTLASFYLYTDICIHRVVGRNIFTQTKEVYCSAMPWYATLVTGEEARTVLLDTCVAELKMYPRDSHQCDVYTNAEMWRRIERIRLGKD